MELHYSDSAEIAALGRAVEVRPGNARVFHHANVVIDCSGSSRRQEKIAGFGFPGMDLAVEENTFDPRSTLPIMEAGKLADG